MAEPDDDALLMQRYAQGDVRAFERLYERHRRGLWRYVQRLVRDPSATDDVFQECWSRVIANRAHYAPAARYSTWLYHIAHNCCMDYFRSSRRRAGRETRDDVTVASVAAATDADPAISAEDLQAGERLARALECLPPEQRSAFLLYVEAGLSVAEIGSLMEVGAETAKSRLRYAVVRLKNALGADAPE